MCSVLCSCAASLHHLTVPKNVTGFQIGARSARCAVSFITSSARAPATPCRRLRHRVFCRRGQGRRQGVGRDRVSVSHGARSGGCRAFGPSPQYEPSATLYEHPSSKREFCEDFIPFLCQSFHITILSLIYFFFRFALRAAQSLG